jgi:hypothetical protein
MYSLPHLNVIALIYQDAAISISSVIPAVFPACPVKLNLIFMQGLPREVLLHWGHSRESGNPGLYHYEPTKTKDFYFIFYTTIQKPSFFKIIIKKYYLNRI